jgi:outer membrane protein assembly factor BamB
LLTLDAGGAVHSTHGADVALGAMAVDGEGAIYHDRIKRGDFVFTKRAPSGETLWTVTMDNPHSRTIDPFEGLTWQGELLSGTLVHTADTLYYVGHYRNYYKRRSESRKKRHNDVSVFALDPATGKARWVQQYRVAPVESPERRVDFTALDAGATPDGDLVVVGNANQGPWMKDGSYITSEQDITLVAFRVDRDGNLVN